MTHRAVSLDFGWFRNGSLSTTARIRAENRYSLRASRGDDLVDGTAIGSIEPAAEGVSQHLLGEAAGKCVAARRSAALSSAGPRKARPPGNRPEESIG